MVFSDNGPMKVCVFDVLVRDISETQSKHIV